jgi:hypothetical protein
MSFKRSGRLVSITVACAYIILFFIAGPRWGGSAITHGRRNSEYHILCLHYFSKAGTSFTGHFCVDYWFEIKSKFLIEKA